MFPGNIFFARSIYLGENATRFHVLFWRSRVDVTRLGFIGPFIVWIRREGVVDDEALFLVSRENQSPVEKLRSTLRQFVLSASVLKTIII